MARPRRSHDDLLDEVRRLRARLATQQHDPEGDTERARSEHLTRAALASSLAAITISDLEGRITYSNPACLQMWGFETAEEVVGRPATDFVADKDAFSEAMRSVREEGSWRGTLLARRRDGSLFHVDAYASLVRDENGEPLAMTASLVDVTGPHRAWEALEETERRLRAILAHSPDLIVLLDRQGKIKYVNRTVTGSRPEEAIGRLCHEFIPEPYRDGWLQSFRRVMGTGDLASFEHEGLGRWWRARFAPLRREEETGGCLVFLTDVTERRRSREELAEARTRLQLALHASNIGAWDWDVKTNEVYFAPEWKAHIGYSDDELPGRYEEWEVRLHPDDRDRVLKALREYLDGSEPEYDVEFRLRHKDGSYRWIRTRGELFRDGDGSPSRMYGCHVDVTELRVAEQALRESEERYRNLIDNLPVAVLHFSPQDGGRIDMANPEALRMLGYSSVAELAARPVSDLYCNPEDRDKLLHELAEGKRRTTNPKVLLRKKDGTPIWASITLERVERDGKPYVYGTVEDITERYRLEQERRGYARRLEALHELDMAILEAQSLKAIAESSLGLLRKLVPFTCAAVVVFEAGSDTGVIVAATPQALGGLHFGESPVLGDMGIDDIEGDYHTRTIEDIGALAAPGSLDRRLLSLGLRSYMCVPILARDGLVGVLTVASEKTGAFRSKRVAVVSEVADVLGVAIRQAQMREELNRYAGELEERVRERTQELEQSNNELELITSSLVDELQVPLRAVRGFAQEMLEEHRSKLEKEIELLAEVISHSATGMKEQLDAIYEYTVAGQKEIVSRVINMDALVRGVLKDLSDPAAMMTEDQPKIEVKTLPQARGDAVLIGKVWNILISNAFRFTEPMEERRIEIGALPGDGETVYYVRDNGVGFDESYSENLFAMFKRLHSPAEFPGTGGGLAIARRILRRHGGRIWGNGKVDAGATFYFALPTGGDGDATESAQRVEELPATGDSPAPDS